MRSRMAQDYCSPWRRARQQGSQPCGCPILVPGAYALHSVPTVVESTSLLHLSLTFGASEAQMTADNSLSQRKVRDTNMRTALPHPCLSIWCHRAFMYGKSISNAFPCARLVGVRVTSEGAWDPVDSPIYSFTASLPLSRTIQVFARHQRSLDLLCRYWTDKRLCYASCARFDAIYD